MFVFDRICLYLLVFACICKYLLVFAGICWCLLAFASICLYLCVFLTVFASISKYLIVFEPTILFTVFHAVYTDNSQHIHCCAHCCVVMAAVTLLCGYCCCCGHCVVVTAYCGHSCSGCHCCCCEHCCFCTITDGSCQLGSLYLSLVAFAMAHTREMQTAAAAPSDMTLTRVHDN